MQAIFEHQKRGGDDEVAYILARNARSRMQLNAAVDMGCRGGGNQCKRGPCFKSAIEMFSGDGMEGVPKGVVLTLPRH